MVASFVKINILVDFLRKKHEIKPPNMEIIADWLVNKGERKKGKNFFLFVVRSEYRYYVER